MSADEPIYLDHNATTPIAPQVLEAMLPFLHTHFGNPSSSHAYGQRTRAAIDEARGQVAGILGAQPSEIIFTSGGTEASNLAILGTAQAALREPGGRPDRRHVLTSAIEHPATAKPCAHLASLGFEVTEAPVDADGRVSVSGVRPDTALVTVMHANNETGVLQPIREIADMARAAGAVVHTDAAQSLGKVPVRVDELNVDLLTVAGHKVYAPKGVGALYVRAGTDIVHQALGAGHEAGMRAGTENVASIVGLGAAAVLAQQDLETQMGRMRALRDDLFERLRAEIPGIRLTGHAELRLPNTLNVRFPDVAGSAMVAHTHAVAASSGSACHEGNERPSAVLLAMGLRSADALGAVRLSLGRGTTEDQVARTAAALAKTWRELH